MKRKITKIEQKLIDKGFVLVKKVYHGKHSEKTLSYVYYGVINTAMVFRPNDNGFQVGVNVILDAKRENIVEFGINDLGKALSDTFTYADLQEIKDVLDAINDFIFDKTLQNADEIVEEIENE